MPGTELTLKQERFAEEYARTGHRTQSAIAAGYSPKGARGTAYVILQNPHVLARVRDLRQQWAETQAAALRDHVEPAIQALRDTIDNPRGKGDLARIQAAVAILDRAGFKPVERVQQEISGPNGGAIPAQIEVVFVEISG